MKIEYATRAVADLRNIADYYASCDNPVAGEKVAARIREVVTRIARLPESGRPVAARPGVRVAPLLRYPYLLFYEVSTEKVRILHIRHTSQRPWSGEE